MIEAPLFLLFLFTYYNINNNLQPLYLVNSLHTLNVAGSSSGLNVSELDQKWLNNEESRNITNSSPFGRLSDTLVSSVVGNAAIEREIAESYSWGMHSRLLGYSTVQTFNPSVAHLGVTDSKRWNCTNFLLLIKYNYVHLHT